MIGRYQSKYIKFIMLIMSFVPKLLFLYFNRPTTQDSFLHGVNDLVSEIIDGFRFHYFNILNKYDVM